MTGRRLTILWWLWLVGLSIFFVATAAVNLANFRPVSADEAAIMDVSYHVATDGVLASDLYADFSGAGSHFFINLPAHHLWQALAFKLIGAGMAQARWVSVIFAVGVIWLVGWLARRWYGVGAALLATGLLLFWRADLIGASPGLPFLVIGRSARYDVATLFWVWLTIALLDRLLTKPGRWPALAVGVTAGLATLTQFYGVFVVPLVVVVWLRRQGRRGLTRPETWLMVLGFGLPAIPYLLWQLSHLADFQGQMAKYGERGAFFSLQFWLENISHEPRRYTIIGQRLIELFTLRAVSFGPLLLLLVIGPALVAVWRRSRRPEGEGDRLLLACCGVFAVLLLLLEHTKAPIYAMILWPAGCLAVAALGRDLWQAFWSWYGRKERRMAVAPVLFVIGIGSLLLLAVEGVAAYYVDRRQAAEVSDYWFVGQEIAARIRPGAVVAGENQWWWALHDFTYRGIKVPFFRAQIEYERTGEILPLAEQLQADGIEYVLINNSFVGPLFDSPPGYRERYWQLLETCSRQVAAWTDFTYSRIELYELQDDCLNETGNNSNTKVVLFVE